MRAVVEVQAGLRAVTGARQPSVPTLVAASNKRTYERYLSFFAAHIRNRNTRAAYALAAERFFGWCESHGITAIESISRLHVAAYVEQMTATHAAPSVKLHLAALRMLFSFLRVPDPNPAEGVRGPRHVYNVGRTPVLTGAQTRRLLSSIPISTLSGLRDRALISVMVYTFGRVSAVTAMTMEDYFMNANRRWVRLREKGGKEHALPLHHAAEDAVEAYLAAINAQMLKAAFQGGRDEVDGTPTLPRDSVVGASKQLPLFRTLDRRGRVTAKPLDRQSAWEMVKRRCRAAGLPDTITNHSFRGTGITVYLDNGGTIENARLIAAHSSIRTTQGYDRRGDAVTLEEINRIHL